MYNTIVTLKKGEGRTIKSGGAWIFDNEIETIMGRFTNGDIVTVHDFDGYYMGIGFINRKSKITVRMMSRVKGTQIDDAFIKMRVKNAIDYRMAVIKEEMAFHDWDLGHLVFSVPCKELALAIEDLMQVFYIEGSPMKSIKSSLSQ